jgi:hypothetical protein
LIEGLASVLTIVATELINGSSNAADIRISIRKLVAELKLLPRGV